MTRMHRFQTLKWVRAPVDVMVISAVALAIGWSAVPLRVKADDATPGPLSPGSNCSVATLAVLATDMVKIDSAIIVQSGSAVYCKVSGRVETQGDGAGAGLAGFELNLPASWNRKFLFVGGGGFDGAIPPTAVAAIVKGYATLGTDSGHHSSSGLDITWVRTISGDRDQPKLADYAWRARHQVDDRVRPLVARYYRDLPIRYAYFMGCSGGGREAMIEAQRHPDDFDGFIAGDPWVNARSALLWARNFKVLLAAPIPYAKFAAIDQAVLEDCDKADGVVDGLIQDPAACRFDPRSLIAKGVLTVPQADALAHYLTAVKDIGGRFITYAGSLSGMGDLSSVTPPIPGGQTGLSAYVTDPPPAGFGPQPWGAFEKGPIDWLLSGGIIAGFAYNDPTLSVTSPMIVDAKGAIAPGAVKTIDHNLRQFVVDPLAMGPLFAKRHKLLIYHGFSDSIADPYSTIGIYRQIIKVGGGLEKARAASRLFMVPEMQHCEGGTGPNSFDPLAAMETWVEHGQPPDALVAAKFPNDDPRKPAQRTMPLCAWPEVARYDGRGDKNTASSWTCPPDDRRLLQIGPAGRAAGVDLDLR